MEQIQRRFQTGLRCHDTGVQAGADARVSGRGHRRNSFGSSQAEAQVGGFLGEVVKLGTLPVAIRHADAWERHARRLEALLVLVTAQRDATNLLLAIAQAELDRLKALTEI